MSKPRKTLMDRLSPMLADTLVLRDIPEFKYVHVSTEDATTRQVKVHFDIGVLRSQAPGQTLSLAFHNNLNAFRRSLHLRLDPIYRVSYVGSPGHGFTVHDVDAVQPGEIFHVRFSFLLRVW